MHQNRLIYPIPDARIVVQDFTIPDHWPRAYGLDIRWNTVAVIWGARNPQTDVLHLFSEYYADADAAIHAAIRSRGDLVVGFFDPRANGRNQADGHRLTQVYRKLGLSLQVAASPIESGILSVLERLHSGRLKVFGSLSKYLEQRRFYRRDESDRIVQNHDSLQDATRCLVSGISRMPAQSNHVPAAPASCAGSMGWAR